MNCGKRPIVAKGGNSSKHLQSWEGKGGTKNPFQNIFSFYLRIYEPKHELAFLKTPHWGCRGTRSMGASTKKNFLFFDYYIFLITI